MRIPSPARKRGLALPAIIAATGLTLAACTPTADQEGAPAGDGDDVPAGGELVVGITSDADNLSPWLATQFQSVNVLQTMYETLTMYDDDLEVAPGLAESWDVSADGLTVTFHLREDVSFHDGTDLDSGDVVHSMESILDESTGAVGRDSLGSVESVEAVDEFTVDFHLSAPDAALPSSLAVVNLAITSADDDLEELDTEPNGTGPFVYDTRTANQSITLERFDDYWGEPAQADSLDLRIIPDETSIMTALEAGNVHFAQLRDPLVAQTATDSVQVESTPELSYHVLQLNSRTGPLTDVNARLAIQCAIDRQGVLDGAAYGEGDVIGPITSPAFLSDPQERPCPERDLEAAADYLAESEYPDGFSFTAIVSQGEYPTSVNEAQALQADLAEANITMDIDAMDIGAFVDRWVDADFEAAVALNGGRQDPEDMYGRYFTSGGAFNDVAGYSSDPLDELLAQGRSEDDHDTRVEIYDEISRELEDQAVWIWLFAGYTYTATTDGVEGFVPRADGSFRNLDNVTVSD